MQKEYAMQRKSFLALFLLLILAVATTLTGCANAGGNVASDNGKIPVTTSSDAAKKEFLAGRDLAEKLQITDSLQHYDKAISLDPNFATAELSRATSSATAKEFFDHLKKAASLADKASNGEKLLILGTEAGTNGNP